MKKIIMSCFLFVSICFSAFCQVENPVIFSPKKMQVGFNAGTSVGFFGNNQSMFSTYLQPTISYQLRPKLYFQTSLLFLNQQLNINRPSEMYERPYNGNSTLIMAGLVYDVNEKLQISGMIYNSLMQPNQQTINGFNNRNWGAVFNATYKVTENFHISGSINVSNGRNGMWGNPWGNGFRTNQFGRLGNGMW